MITTSYVYLCVQTETKRKRFVTIHVIVEIVIRKNSYTTFYNEHKTQSFYVIELSKRKAITITRNLFNRNVFVGFSTLPRTNHVKSMRKS